MAVLDRAKAHFRGLAVKSIDVAEWGENGQPLKVFFKTPNGMTIAELLGKAEGDNIRYAAMLVAKMATDEAGERLFPGPYDYRDLMTDVHPAIVGRIAAAISDGASLDGSTAQQAESEKN